MRNPQVRQSALGAQPGRLPPTMGGVSELRFAESGVTVGQLQSGLVPIVSRQSGFRVAVSAKHDRAQIGNRFRKSL